MKNFTKNAIALFISTSFIIFSLFVLILFSEKKSIAQLMCEENWKAWDKEKNICSEEIYIDEIDRIEEKQIWKTGKNYDISIIYYTFGVSKFDRIIKWKIENLIRDFENKIKTINLEKWQKAQYIINSIYTRNKDLKFVSLILESQDSLNTTTPIDYITLNYDIKTGSLFTLKDIFLPKTNIGELLFPIVEKRLNIKLNDEEKDEKNLEKFYIDKRLLVIIFPRKDQETGKISFEEVRIPFINIDYTFKESMLSWE